MDIPTGTCEWGRGVCERGSGYSYSTYVVLNVRTNDCELLQLNFYHDSLQSFLWRRLQDWHGGVENKIGK